MMKGMVDVACPLVVENPLRRVGPTKRIPRPFGTPRRVQIETRRAGNCAIRSSDPLAEEGGNDQVRLPRLLECAQELWILQTCGVDRNVVFPC